MKLKPCLSFEERNMDVLVSECVHEETEYDRILDKLDMLERTTGMIWVLYEFESQSLSVEDMKTKHYTDLEDFKAKDPLLFNKIAKDDRCDTYSIYFVYRPVTDKPSMVYSTAEMNYLSPTTRTAVIKRGLLSFSGVVELEDIKSRLLQLDPKLKQVFDTVTVDFDSLKKPPYLAVVGAIIGQRIDYKRAKQLRGKFFRAFNGEPMTIDQMLAIGLAPGQATTIDQLNKHVAVNPLNNTDDIRVLKVVPGIGKWTITTAILNTMDWWQSGKVVPTSGLDVFPVSDYFLKQRCQRLYGLVGLPTEAKMRSMSKEWSPYRAIVTWYLWRWF